MRPGFKGICFWLLGMGVALASAQAPTGTIGASNEILTQALERLYSSDKGRPLLERAVSLWKLHSYRELASVIELGTQSKTDSVLTRHFDPSTGNETRERSVHVLLKIAQKREDLLLDLAHELVHATARAEWDPYDPSLTPVQYIASSIEGPGGEVEAVIAECEVAFEIYGQSDAAFKRCGTYAAPASITLSREAIRRDFYRVGKWYSELLQKTGREAEILRYLSPERPRLYSSTGGAPYPVSLFREYEELTAIACENSRQRAEASGRNPASVRVSSGRVLAGQLLLARRCGRPTVVHSGH